MGAKKIADKIVRKYKTRNPFEIIKGMNVFVVYTHLEKVNGFYQYYKRNNIIYINEDLSENEKIFVCAHELGHMLMHKKTNRIFMDAYTNLNSDKYENEANAFAIELLLSDTFIDEHKELTTEQFSRLTGYAKELIELKLKNMNTKGV